MMPTPRKTSTARKPAAKSKPATTYGVGWGSPLADVKMPSGSTAQLRRPGVSGLVAAGVLENVDALSNLVVTQHVNRARGQRPAKKTVDSKKILADPNTVKQVFEVMEKVMCYVVVQPQVLPEPRDAKGQTIPEPERDSLEDGQIWSNWVPQDDMVFIVNYAVGGTTDLARFRKEFGELLGDVSAGASIQL